MLTADHIKKLHLIRHGESTHNLAVEVALSLHSSRFSLLGNSQGGTNRSIRVGCGPLPQRARAGRCIEGESESSVTRVNCFLSLNSCVENDLRCLWRCLSSPFVLHFTDRYPYWSILSQERVWRMLVISEPPSRISPLHLLIPVTDFRHLLPLWANKPASFDEVVEVALLSFFLPLHRVRASLAGYLVVCSC